MNFRAVVSAIAIFCFSLSAYSQQYTNFGGRAAALGGSGILLEDAWLAQNNPAGLSQLNHFSAGLYMQRLHNIKELNSGAVAMALPLQQGKGGTIGLALSAFNASTALLHQQATVSYGLKLSPEVNAGIGLHVNRLKFGDIYGSTTIPAASAGIRYGISDNTFLSAHAYNAVPVKIKGHETLPVLLSFGLRQDLSEQLAIFGAVMHRWAERTALSTGVEYRAAENIELQLGLKTNPLLFGAGAGFAFKNIRIHLAFGFHQVLGTTPHLTWEYGQLAEE